MPLGNGSSKQTIGGNIAMSADGSGDKAPIGNRA